MFLFEGVACQVSAAIVSAVSALTYQLGKQLAPIIVEQGTKVKKHICIQYNRNMSDVFAYTMFC